MRSVCRIYIVRYRATDIEQHCCGVAVAICVYGYFRTSGHYPEMQNINMATPAVMNEFFAVIDFCLDVLS